MYAVIQTQEADRANAEYERARQEYHAAPVGSHDELLAYLEMSNALFERERSEKEARNG